MPKAGLALALPILRTPSIVEYFDAYSSTVLHRRSILCAGQYSVREAFQGSTVLITGATGKSMRPLKHLFCICVESAMQFYAGYIGGLVLEQLLRVGHISKVNLFSLSINTLVFMHLSFVQLLTNTMFITMYRHIW